jgi:hypothetical protein
MKNPHSERGDVRMPNTVPYTTVSIPEVMTRNSAARHIVAGFAAATPSLAPMWQQISAALADAGGLAAEAGRLSAELRAARLDRANLLAAIRATLAAERDVEPDPLFYLRDELRAAHSAGESRPGGSDG